MVLRLQRSSDWTEHLSTLQNEDRDVVFLKETQEYNFSNDVVRILKLHSILDGKLPCAAPLGYCVPGGDFKDNLSSVPQK